MWQTIFLVSIAFLGIGHSQKVFKALDAELTAHRLELASKETALRKSFNIYAETSMEAVTALQHQNQSQTQVEALKSACEEASAIIAAVAACNWLAVHRKMFTCMDVHQRLVELNFELRRHAQVSERVRSNATRLSAIFDAVKKFNSTAKPPKVEKLCDSLKNASKELSNFAQLLDASVATTGKQIGQLTQLFSEHCVCGKRMSDLSLKNVSATVAATVRHVETPLVKMQLELRKAAAKSALNDAKAASLLAKMATVDDFADSTESTSVASCGDLSAQIGLLHSKVAKFEDVRASCVANVTALASHMDGELLEHLKSFEEQLKSYKVELESSIDYTAKIINNMQIMLDHYCTCDIKEITTTFVPKTEPTVALSTTTATKTTALPTVSPAPGSGRGHACVLWTRYLGDWAPYKNGLSAGLSFSGTQAFVGRLFNGNLLDSFDVARLEIKNDSKCFFTKHTNACVSPENFKEFGVEYLVIRKGCSCEWRKWSPNKIPKFAVFFKKSVIKVRYIGRTTLEEEGVDLVDIHVTIRNKIPSSNATNSTLMLACESGPLSEPAQIYSPNKACAYWSPYLMNDEPARHGLVLGVSLNNKTLYIGRIISSRSQHAARLQIEEPRGIHYLENNYSLKEFQEFLLISSDCYCWFADFDEALGRVGLLLTLSNYGFGRRKLSKQRMALTEVAIVNRTERWYYEWSSQKTDEATAMLVCEVI